MKLAQKVLNKTRVEEASDRKATRQLSPANTKSLWKSVGKAEKSVKSVVSIAQGIPSLITNGKFNKAFADLDRLIAQVDKMKKSAEEDKVSWNKKMDTIEGENKELAS